MSTSSWNAKLTVGVATLDKQHRRLLEIIDAIISTVETSGDLSAIEKLLHSLIDLAKAHFQQEEALMRANAYPQFDRHRLQHERMITTLRGFYQGIQSRQPLDSIKLTVFLQTWLSVHLQSDDQKYVPFLSNKSA